MRNAHAQYNLSKVAGIIGTGLIGKRLVYAHAQYNLSKVAGILGTGLIGKRLMCACAV